MFDSLKKAEQKFSFNFSKKLKDNVLCFVDNDRRSSATQRIFQLIDDRVVGMQPKAVHSSTHSSRGSLEGGRWNIRRGKTRAVPLTQPRFYAARTKTETPKERERERERFGIRNFCGRPPTA